MKRRVEWIDTCKGFGIFTMICGHIGLPYIIDKYIHAWNMPIFFILSGYLFREYKIKDLIIRKSKSLLIPYFSFGAILYILSILKNFLKNDTNLLKQLVDLFTINTVGDLPFGNSLWFLTCIFCVEVIFIILNNYSNSEKLLGSRILIICCVGFLFSYLNIRLIWGLDSAMTGVGFYYFGYLISKYKENKITNKIYSSKISSIIILFLIGTIGIFINGYVNMRTINYSNIILFYINAIANSLIIIMISMHICKGSLFKNIRKSFIYLGKNSLVFLAFNQVIIYIIKNTLELFVNNKIIISIITLFITIIVLSLISLIINSKFEFLLGRFTKNKLLV